MKDASPAGGPPLARLFAIAYRVLIDSLHERLRAQGWPRAAPARGLGPSPLPVVPALRI